MNTRSYLLCIFLLGTGTIAMAVPVVNFETASDTVAESAGSVSVAVTMVPAPTTRTIVAFNPTVAEANLVLVGTLADVTAVPLNVTFNVGETRKVFTVKITNDVRDEDDEAFTLSFKAGAAYTVGAQSSHRVIITDNDTRPAVSITSGATKILFAGNPATPLFLNATGTGTPPLSYQWLLNGKPIAKATKASYYLPTVAWANAGLYSCTVSNPVAKGVASTNKVEIGVISHTYQKLTVKGTADVVLSQVVSANVGFRWFRDESATEYVAATGVAKYSATKNTLTLLKATPFTQVGTFVCKPYLKSNGAVTATGNQYIADYVQKAAKLPASLALKHAVVGIPYTEFVTAAADSGAVVWGATSLPKGLVMDPVSGQISGIPTLAGKAKVTVSASNGIGLPAKVATFLDVDPAPFVGNISGMMERHPSNNDLGGIVNITITSTGSFTGRYTSGGVVLPFTGLGLGFFPGDFVQPSGFTQFYSATGKFYSLSFHYNHIVPGAGLGTLVSADSPDFTLNPVSLNFTLHGGLAGTLPSGGDYVGVYNFSTAFKTFLPGDQQPRGTSIGSATVLANGSVNFIMRMSDGTLFTSANAIAYDHSINFYAWLYNNKGSFMAQPVVTLTGTDNADSTIADALASWSKLPDTTPGKRAYAAGWPGSEMNLTGQKWKPNSGVTTLGLTYTSGVPNAALTFLDGGLDTSAALPNVQLTITDIGAVGAIPALLNPCKTYFVLEPIKGSFGGTFTITTSQASGPPIKRPATIYGQLQGNTGVGFFLLPKLPDTSTVPPQTFYTSSMLSGSVSLSALPQVP
ncbi:MAG: propanediol utilization protein [Verrucomicrobiaceae bacterium]|nr:propanediol utilization protein [Verrucomicrobiaceae bacterium]